MIKCQDSAIKYLLDEVLKGKGRVIKEVNKSRHKIVELDSKERWYCVYKREFYHTFSKEYDYLGQKYDYFKDCEGESLNQEALKEAQRNACDKVVFIHPEGVYYQYLTAFLNFAVTNDLLRIQDKENEYLFKDGIKKKVQEITYSVPVPYLERIC
jgi:hypothetical protein